MDHIEKIRAALAKRGLDAVLVTDEKNQRYAAGFPFTDGAVLVGTDRAWLITDSRYIEAASAAASGVEVQLYDREHPLVSLLKEDIAAAGIRTLAAEDEKLSRKAFADYEKELGLSFAFAGDLFAQLRAAKDEEEIRCMRQAQAVSEKALDALLHILRPGMTEREAAAELVYHMLKNGSEGNSFDPIVISGEKTSMPHGVPGDRVIRAGDFVTMDFGCIVGGYCSDMTRTVAVGSATEEMRHVYGIVLEAQLAGIAAAGAGVPGCHIDAAARRVIDKAGYGAYFGHGFGHSLGLDIHEWPNANPRGAEPMPEGAVCSAEPGIYLPGRFGVRIEDVMILRAGGCEVITKAGKDFTVIGG